MEIQMISITPGPSVYDPADVAGLKIAVKTITGSRTLTYSTLPYWFGLRHIGGFIMSWYGIILIRLLRRYVHGFGLDKEKE